MLHWSKHDHFNKRGQKQTAYRMQHTLSLNLFQYAFYLKGMTVRIQYSPENRQSKALTQSYGKYLLKLNRKFSPNVAADLLVAPVGKVEME